MSQYHELKIWKEFLEDVKSGKKTFEVRKNDRGFEVGDTLILRGWNNEKQEYTGHKIECLVTYLLVSTGIFGIEKGYVIMSIVVTNYNF